MTNMCNNYSLNHDRYDRANLSSECVPRRNASRSVQGVTFGYSLLELMVTVAVLAITMAIVLPSFGNLLGGNRISTQASELQTALIYARTEAVRLNQDIVLCHSSDGVRCSSPSAAGWQGWLVRAAGVSIENPTGPTLRTGIIPAAPLQVSSGPELAKAGHVIRYNPQGLARKFGDNTPLSDSIRICMAQAAVKPNIRTVFFNSGGRSRIESSDASGQCL